VIPPQIASGAVDNEALAAAEAKVADRVTDQTQARPNGGTTSAFSQPFVTETARRAKHRPEFVPGKLAHGSTVSSFRCMNARGNYRDPQAPPSYA